MTKTNLLFVAIVLLLMSSAGVLLTINMDQNPSINIHNIENSEHGVAARSDNSSNPLNITTIDLPSGTEDESYSAQLNATGGAGNYTWEIVSGELPPGLTLSTNGSISGEPEETGTFEFTVRVTDGNGSRDERRLRIKVLPEEGSDVLLILSIIVTTGLLIGLVVWWMSPTKSTGRGIKSIKEKSRTKKKGKIDKFLNNKWVRIGGILLLMICIFIIVIITDEEPPEDEIVIYLSNHSSKALTVRIYIDGEFNTSVSVSAHQRSTAESHPSGHYKWWSTGIKKGADFYTITFQLYNRDGKYLSSKEIVVYDKDLTLIIHEDLTTEVVCN